MLKPSQHMSPDAWPKFMKGIYYGLYFCIIILAGLVAYFNYTGIAIEGGGRSIVFAPTGRVGLIIQYLAIIYTLAVIPGVLYWMKRSCAKIAKIEDESLKYDTYYTYASLRMILIAVGSLISFFAYFLLGGHQPMLWLAAIGAVALVFTKPTPGKAEAELRREDENNPTY